MRICFSILVLCGLLAASTPVEAGLACSSFVGKVVAKEEKACTGTCPLHYELTDNNLYPYHFRVFVKIEDDWSDDHHWYEITWRAYIDSGRVGATAQFTLLHGGYIKYARKISK